MRTSAPTQRSRNGEICGETRPSGADRGITEGAPMACRRAGWAALTAGVLVVSVAAVPGFGSPRAPIRFAAPIFVDRQRAGGEPAVFYDARHQDYVYTAHEGTTHTLHDGVIEAPAEDTSWASNYRNQVNIWTSRDGRRWARVDLNGSGFVSDPTENTGFSD